MSAEGELPLGARRIVKSESAFRTISEVAEDLDVPQHVLRFWESKFPQVRPLKRGGGRRYYRPEDVALLRRIRDLLYSEGYTIKGVQKLLREGGHRDTVAPTLPLIEEPDLLVSVEGPAATVAPHPDQQEGEDGIDGALILDDGDADDGDFQPMPEPAGLPVQSAAVPAPVMPAPTTIEPPPPAPPTVAAIAAAATALASAVGPVPDTEDEDDMSEDDEIAAEPAGFSPAQRRELEALLDELEEMRALLS